MPFAYCRLACIPLHSEPDLCSAMTSQVLFAETFEILECQGHYARVRLDHDGYEGWIDQRQSAEITGTEHHWMSTESSPAFVADPVCSAGLGSRCLTLVRGTPLPGYGNGKFVLPGEIGWVHGSVSRSLVFEQQTFLDSLEAYLHAPYLWGGRTPLGIDCSGLVQMAYRPFGIALPRDSMQQREVGEPVPDMAEARPGDLAFFTSGVDDSSHVGIVLPKGRILHASASVRIDSSDARGIIRSSSGKRTHHLVAIKRLLPA